MHVPINCVNPTCIYFFFFFFFNVCFDNFRVKKLKIYFGSFLLNISTFYLSKLFKYYN
jgi:hypothetical protein